mmetsp:Transcript_49933/g.150178  ORF Transcript_49933/g.150178 Transcript_49933/m.150178 type:complete len:392 (-) Transcript_49933:182-1357(-)
MYSVDFNPSSLFAASPTRKAVHFVRRRKIVRVRTFDPPNLLLPHGGESHVMTCDHCDSDAVRFLSSKLLEALAVASLMGQNFKRGKKNDPPGRPEPMRDAKVLGLKRQLIESLQLGRPAPVIGPPTADGLHVSGDGAVRLSALVAQLDRFGRERGNNFMSRASRVFNQTFDDDVVRCLDERKSEAELCYFPRDERDAIATITVKHLDPEFKLHCDRTDGCGERCDFALLPCPNEGCEQFVSKKHRDEHDSRCGFKVVGCPRNCGDEVPRNRMDVHMSDACPRREVKCPLHTLGCTAVVLAKDLPGHMTENSNSHILLTANRMMEHQGVIKQLHGRVEKLQIENVELRQKLEEYKKDAEKDARAVDKKVGKVSKQLGALESLCRSEFRSHKK